MGIIIYNKMKVVFAGIAKNAGSNIYNVISSIEETSKLFDDYRVIIYENDSIDNTLKILKNWEYNNDKVYIISEKLGKNSSRDLSFMARARNIYLDIVFTYYRDYDLMIVCDMDLGKKWSVDGIKDSLNKIDVWDAVCSYGVHSSEDLRMYDAFAFLKDEYDKIYDYPVDWSSVYPVRQIIYPKDRLEKVSSCFGGLAIYKIKKIQGCRYESNGKKCEHISFNKCVNNMYMNTNQIIYWH